MVEDSCVTVDGDGVRKGDVGVRIEVHRSHFADWSTGHDTKSANSCGGASAPTRPSGVGHEKRRGCAVKDEEGRLAESLLRAGENPAVVRWELVAGDAD